MRSQTSRPIEPQTGARAGETINVPANAPHAFTNASDHPSRLLCLCDPAGQEEFFTLVGQSVAARTEAPPPLDHAAQTEFIAKSQALAPRYKTELLPSLLTDEQEPDSVFTLELMVGPLRCAKLSPSRQ